MGAEISGLDLSATIHADTSALLSGLLATHGILAFRSQAISDEIHARLGRCFGELARFRTIDNWEGAVPEIFRSANVDSNGHFLPMNSERMKMLKLNWLWHIDGSFRPIPTGGAVLRSIETVEDGGDTIFANLHAAYEALPAQTKSRIDGLFARHSFEYMVERQGMPPLTDSDKAALQAVNHPLVRWHSDGRRSLYLSPTYMETILGLDQPESRALIGELTNWSTQERFLYRHCWQPNDVIVWDNGWTMHIVAPYDISRKKRIMHGVVILGNQRIEPIFPGMS